ncbi:hypothetical protein [Ferrimonas gelatinilytica]|uniref:SulA-like leucine-rich domain-containing protein n=1 Tax=Ferrimonas gelatinilytica TaxID=1255257 RepID=A0ABP9SBD9_9GAMM
MKLQQGTRFNHPGLWQSSRRAWPAMDTQCHDSPGAGLQRVLPAAAEAAGQQGWVVLINPPAGNWAATLARAGVDSRRVLRVRSSDDVEALWALEQALTGATCALVLGWLPVLDARDRRRLQLVQRRAHCSAYLFHGERGEILHLANPVH